MPPNILAKKLSELLPVSFTILAIIQSIFNPIINEQPIITKEITINENQTFLILVFINHFRMA
jgi:hypothetical protein